MYFYLKEPNGKDKTLIIIQYYLKKDKKIFKYSTGQKIEPGNWNFESRFPKNKRGGGGKEIKHISLMLSRYNDFLESTLNDLERNNIDATKDTLKNYFDSEFKADKSKTIQFDSKVITNVIDAFILSKSKSKGKSKDWENKYKNLRNKMLLFDTYKNHKTVFNDLSNDWLDEYSGFLRELPELLKKQSYLKKVKELDVEMKLPKVVYNDNTLNRHIIYLFTFLNWSKDSYHDLNLDKLKNPVKDFVSDDIHLTSEEVKLLETVELPRESLKRVRDLFLIGVYSGQRFSDYSVFEKADVQGDMIIKRAEKTEKDSFVPLHTKLKKLLEQYEWKLPKISSQKFNPHIVEVCRIAGILTEVKTTNYIGNKKEVKYFEKCDMVSSHTARRTFITLSAENNMPDHIIMKIVGISDPKTLIKYKKTSQQSVSDFANKIWG
ncbi:MAG: hypothetical protein COA88_15685 [Kordia sp.]|nr:MAG: hypothetical protein COA88_15685 [Kordia sp.]